MSFLVVAAAPCCSAGEQPAQTCRRERADRAPQEDGSGARKCLGRRLAKCAVRIDVGQGRRDLLELRLTTVGAVQPRNPVRLIVAVTAAAVAPGSAALGAGSRPASELTHAA